MPRVLVPLLAMALIGVGIWIEIARATPGGHRLSANRAVMPPAQAPESRAVSVPPPIVSAPFVDTAPATRAEAATSSRPYVEVVVFEVVRENGRPIARADVFATVSGDDRQHGQTDASGIAEFPARRGEVAEISVFGATFGPFATSLALDPGRHRIVVPDGDRIAGRVVVDGRTPAEPFRLSLSMVGNTETDAAGLFEFFNLPRGASFTLQAEEGYRLLAPDLMDVWWLEVTAPTVALLLQVTEQPAIKGRLVAHGSREPVMGTVIATLTSGGETSGSQIGIGDDGRFRVMAIEGQTHAVLRISNAALLGTRTIEVPGPLATVRDLGDVELAPIRTIEVRVRDADGQPIAGAVAGIDGTRARGAPTDARGVTSLEAEERGGSLRVAHLGHATAVVPIQDDVQGPIDVVLQSGNLLVIDVQRHDGTSPPDYLFHVRLASPDPIFTGPDGMSDSLLEEAGASSSFEQSTGPEGSSIVFEVVGGSPIKVAGLRPGASLAVELLGATIHDVVDRKFLSAPTAGVTNLTLRANAAPQTFQGRVRTREGAPIDSADVWIHPPDESADAYGQTAQGGRFAFPGVFAPSVVVRIQANGFVPLVEKDVPVPPPGADRDFILTPTCDVTIELVDEDGRRIEDVPLLVVRDAGSDSIEPTAAENPSPGEFLVTGLAPATIEILVTLGTAHVVVEHDARIPHVRIVVPGDGVLDVAWSREGSDPVDARLAIYRLGGTVPVHDAVPNPSDEAPQVSVAIPPGIYFAAIEAFDQETAAWVALATSRAFEVRTRERTEVAITR